MTYALLYNYLFFLFLLTSFTVIMIRNTRTKNPVINCHQYSIAIDFKMTVNTTKNRINVAISLACLSLILAVGNVFPFNAFK